MFGYFFPNYFNTVLLRKMTTFLKQQSCIAWNRSFRDVCILNGGCPKFLSLNEVIWKVMKNC